MAKKIIDKGAHIAKQEGVRQRQSYKRVSKQLLRDTYNSEHPKRRKKAHKAHKKYEYGNKVGLILSQPNQAVIDPYSILIR